MTNNKEQTPHGFCETPEQKCTMNYCDENGCQNRKRTLAEPIEMTYNKEQTAVEWLEQEMLKPNLSMKEILEQAKEMEKEQIEQVKLDAKEIIIIKHTEHGGGEQ